MQVEFVPTETVRSVRAAIEGARESMIAPDATPGDDETGYWESVFEHHAAAVLAALGGVRIEPGHVVRYRYYGRQGRDLLVRPFVAREGTDVEGVRRILDWHPAPDTVVPSRRGAPSADADLLYRHFHFEPTAVGYFRYWAAMQELWASARWIHSRIIADAVEFAEVLRPPGWQVSNPPERFEPAVILEEGRAAQLAILLYCPLDTQSVTLSQVRIDPDRCLHQIESVPVAHGPRGYLA